MACALQQALDQSIEIRYVRLKSGSRKRHTGIECPPTKKPTIKARIALEETKSCTDPLKVDQNEVTRAGQRKATRKKQ